MHKSRQQPLRQSKSTIFYCSHKIVAKKELIQQRVAEMAVIKVNEAILKGIQEESQSLKELVALVKQRNSGKSRNAALKKVARIEQIITRSPRNYTRQ